MKLVSKNYKLNTYKKADFVDKLTVEFFSQFDLHILGSNEYAVIQDFSIEALNDLGLISQPQVDVYYDEIRRDHCNFTKDIEIYFEEYYERIFKVRNKHFSNVEAFLYKKNMNNLVYSLNEADKLKRMMQEYSCVVIAAEKVECPKEYLQKLLDSYQDHQVILILAEQYHPIYYSVDDVKDFLGNNIQQITYSAKSALINFEQFDIACENCFLHVIGETFLMNVKSMNVEAFIEGTATTTMSQIYLNYFEPSLFKIHVPIGFDINEGVPLVEKIKISYGQLAHFDLKRYKDSFELIRQKPSIFLDFIQAKEYTIHGFSNVKTKNDMEYAKKEWVMEQMSCSDELRYQQMYLNEEMKSIELDFDKNQSAYLVDVITLNKSDLAEVIFQKERPLRSPRNILKTEEDYFGICSNFMFFSTSRLLERYNYIRKERIDEQLPLEVFHLDYAKATTETFPLFDKGTLVRLNDGTFRITKTTLKSGVLKINGEEVVFSGNDVNPSIAGDVAIYTPMMSTEVNEPMSYIYEIDNGRENLVIVNQRVVCMKENVLMTQFGIVLSLSKEYAKKYVWYQKIKDKEIDFSQLMLELKLDNPSELSNETWSQVDWAYGGAIVLAGKNKDDILSEMRKEGWMKALSCQTQESMIHEFSYHPRTAFCLSKTNQLSICVFSGRQGFAKSVNYEEMVNIIYEILPDTEIILNADGGASSALSYYDHRGLIEISYPCASLENSAGILRNLTAIMKIEMRRKKV